MGQVMEMRRQSIQMLGIQKKAPIKLLGELKMKFELDLK